MPSIETSIWLALKAHVTTLVLPNMGQAFDPAKQVHWPNEAFTKPQGGNPLKLLPYLRVTWVPNFNRRRFIASDAPHQRIGLMQVDVFYPLNKPVAEAVEIAGKIAEHFPTDLRLGADGLVRITSAPSVGQPMPDDTHIQVPVTIEYEAWA